MTAASINPLSPIGKLEAINSGKMRSEEKVLSACWAGLMEDNAS